MPGAILTRHHCRVVPASLLGRDEICGSKTAELTLARNASLEIRRHYRGSEGMASIDAVASQRVDNLPVLRVLAEDRHLSEVGIVLETLIRCSAPLTRNAYVRV